MQSNSGRVWQLGECLGAGTYGSVYRAVDRQSNGHSEYALKFARLGRADAFHRHNQPPDVLTWEMNLLARLKHPNIISVIDAGPDFFVMPLMDTLPNTTQAAMDVKSVLRQLMGALVYIHSHNIAHCDVSPGNVLYERGTTRLVLCDWGNARIVDDAGTIDISRNPLLHKCGTCCWTASPECYNEESGDVIDYSLKSTACDVWAASVTALAMAGAWASSTWWRTPDGPTFERLFVERTDLISTIDKFTHNLPLATMLASLVFQPQVFRASAARVLAELDNC